VLVNKLIERLLQRAVGIYPFNKESYRHKAWGSELYTDLYVWWSNSNYLGSVGAV